jgi:hypothetical protein
VEEIVEDKNLEEGPIKVQNGSGNLLVLLPERSEVQKISRAMEHY